MVNVTRGVFVTCDPALREFLLHLHEKQPFIVKTLDATHLLIDPSKVDWLREKIASHHETITFTEPELK